MGEQRMRRGDQELEAGEFDEACASYLAATDHYWLALSGARLREAERRAVSEAHISAFRSAMPLLPHPATPLGLVVQDIQVTGYLFLPAGITQPCQIVIWPVEPDASLESSYRQVGVSILGSGLGCVVCTSVEGDRRHRGDATAWAWTDALTGAVAQWARQQPGVAGTAEPLRLHVGLGQERTERSAPGSRPRGRQPVSAAPGSQ